MYPPQFGGGGLRGGMGPRGGRGGGPRGGRGFGGRGGGFGRGRGGRGGGSGGGDSFMQQGGGGDFGQQGPVQPLVSYFSLISNLRVQPPVDLLFKFPSDSI